MKKNDEAYGAFAYAYDQALGRRFFAAVRPLLDHALSQYPTSRKTHLDVACGTGLASSYFREQGWRSVGVDASMPMLMTGNLREKGTVVVGDARALPLRQRFSRITCLYDSLNHLTDRHDLVGAFRAIRALMDHDSLLLFDMNHPEIYPAVWGVSDPFVASGRDYHLEIATTFRRRDAIGIANVTGWAGRGRRKTTIREQHRQRAYSEREIVESLGEAALRPVDVVEFDPYGTARELGASTVKLFFVCAPVTTDRERPS